MLAFLKPNDEKALDWYFTQTAFERGSGIHAEISAAMHEAAVDYTENRYRFWSSLNSERKRKGTWSAGDALSWGPEEITARPTAELRTPVGVEPSLSDYTRKAQVEGRLRAMERAGHVRASLDLKHCYDPVGGFFDDSKLPRAYALILHTDGGQKLLVKARKLLNEHKGERDAAPHMQMAMHCQRRTGGNYGEVRELFGSVELLVNGRYRSACVAWNAARVQRFVG